jgi:hypothetical protein
MTTFISNSKAADIVNTLADYNRYKNTSYTQQYINEQMAKHINERYKEYIGKKGINPDRPAPTI